MRKLLLASALVLTASVASAGTIAPAAPDQTVEVVPAPAVSGSLGGATTWLVLLIVAALIASANQTSD